MRVTITYHPPTAPGWYWYRPKDGEWEVVSLPYYSAGEPAMVARAGHLGFVELTELSGDWGPPIPSPGQVEWVALPEGYVTLDLL